MKAAKLSDAQAQLALNLEKAQEALATAQANVAEVSGLAGAISLYNSRTEALEAAEADQSDAVAAQAGAKASYESKNTAITIDPTDGTVAGLIIVLDDGELVLADNVTETTNPGVTSLLAAVQARVAADANVTAATGAQEAAVIAIGYLDFDAADAPKDAIGAEFRTPVTGDAANALTQSAIQAELNVLKGEGSSEVSAAADPNVLTFNETTGKFEGTGLAGTAAENYNSLDTAVENFELTLVAQTAGEYDFNTAPLTSAQITAQGYITTAEEAITNLEELLSDLSEAQATATALESLNTAITDAEAVFEDLGVESPVALEGNVIATAESDLFLAGSVDSSVFNFGAQGEDQIFFGEDYSLVQIPTGSTIANNVGDAAALEVLWQQDGNNLVLYVEQQAFGGNSAGTNEIATITLTGVNAEDITFEGGYLSAGTVEVA